MKYQVRKTVYIDISMDQSEAIMFSKGGRHTCKIPVRRLLQEFKDISSDEDGYDDTDPAWYFPEIEVTIQISNKNMYDFITQK